MNAKVTQLKKLLFNSKKIIVMLKEDIKKGYFQSYSYLNEKQKPTNKYVPANEIWQHAGAIVKCSGWFNFEKYFTPDEVRILLKIETHQGCGSGNYGLLSCTESHELYQHKLWIESMSEKTCTDFKQLYFDILPAPKKFQ